MCRFLRLAVEYALEGKSSELKEYLIGTEVFDRGDKFDPRVDPVVRVEARRLRTKLSAYYAGEAAPGEPVIALPKGTYVPDFGEVRDGLTRDSQPATLALIPFRNLSSDPEHEYFSDGLTQELIQLLTRVPGLRVAAWTTAARIRELEPAAIGHQLRVGSVLTGTVRAAGNRVRVTAQLIDTTTGHYRWSESFDGSMLDVLGLQDELAAAIARILAQTLALPHRSPAPNPEAYQLYLKGRFQWNKRTSVGITRSVELFRQATEIAPELAVAWAGLADAYTLLSDYGLRRPLDIIPAARQAAQRALELDPLLGEAETSLGMIRAQSDWEWEEAERHYKRAIALNPGYATAHHWYSLDLLALLGRFTEAERELQLALEIDPLSPIVREGSGYIHMLQRQYGRAVLEYRKLAEVDPQFYKAYTAIGRVFIQLGKFTEAIEMLERGAALEGTPLPNILGALGQAYAFQGNQDKARSILGQIESMGGERHVPCVSSALVLLALGEKECALRRLEDGIPRRDPALTVLAVHPVWDSLRDEPAFQRIVRRVYGSNVPRLHS